jgi:transcriptional regulator with XRE-family HTH domain
MQIGDTLKLLRLQRGLTQEKLAKMADMKQSAISRIEKNKGLPNADRFEPLAKALGVSPADFFAQSVKISPAVASEQKAPDIDSSIAQNLSSDSDENKIIEAYRKLEQDSSKKKAVDILLFSETKNKEN